MFFSCLNSEIIALLFIMILKMLLGSLPEFLQIFTTATLPLTLSLRVSPKIRELIGGLCFFLLLFFIICKYSKAFLCCVFEDDIKEKVRRQIKSGFLQLINCGFGSANTKN